MAIKEVESDFLDSFFAVRINEIFEYRKRKIDSRLKLYLSSSL